MFLVLSVRTELQHCDTGSGGMLIIVVGVLCLCGCFASFNSCFASLSGHLVFGDIPNS